VCQGAGKAKNSQCQVFFSFKKTARWAVIGSSIQCLGWPMLHAAMAVVWWANKRCHSSGAQSD
jgi:protein-S-isoprenylcysteine O-methyltransferase Ste14